MKQKMKLLLAGLLATVNLSATEILFDLKAQDFMLSKIRSEDNAFYKISDQVIFETNMNKAESGDFYFPINHNKRTIADIHLTHPLKNWIYTFELTLRAGNYSSDAKRTIILKDINESLLICEFGKKGYKINGKHFDKNLVNRHFILQIAQNENVLTAFMNGEKVYEEKVNFFGLKKIASKIGGDEVHDKDFLYGMTLAVR